ncbi:MAG: 3-dehydroquinate synthase [Candidatus Omnitrophica bacterium]|nr:3-dehydroquinate synthase [Candidatus Omnitrophota bacterium]
MKKIKVNLGKRSYQIVIGDKISSQIGSLIKSLQLGEDALVITNSFLKKRFGLKLAGYLKKSGYTVKFEVVPDSEKSKSAKQVFRLIDRIGEYDVKRRLFIIALGGGVIGDLSGFVAAIYKRGVNYIQVPSTFLAQIDSAIGGKTAVDLSLGKNLVGAFYQPRLVLSDISVLLSLDKKQIRSGLAEAIKYGVIQDRQLFEFIEKNTAKIINLNQKALEYIVYRCSRIKAKIIQIDETETKGIRTILNYGHTIGHALETAGGYQVYSHGEAVALGMIAAARIARDLNLLDDKSCWRIKNLISKAGLPTSVRSINRDKLLNAISHDKKFIRGKNRFVLPVKIGKVIVREGIPLSIIKKSINSLMK